VVLLHGSSIVKKMNENLNLIDNAHIRDLKVWPSKIAEVVSYSNSLNSNQSMSSVKRLGRIRCGLGLALVS
jgi:hypothetical protein